MEVDEFRGVFSNTDLPLTLFDAATYNSAFLTSTNYLKLLRQLKGRTAEQVASLLALGVQYGKLSAIPQTTIDEWVTFLSWLKSAEGLAAQQTMAHQSRLSKRTAFGLTLAESAAVNALDFQRYELNREMKEIWKTRERQIAELELQINGIRAQMEIEFEVAKGRHLPASEFTELDVPTLNRRCWDAYREGEEGVGAIPSDAQLETAVNSYSSAVISQHSRDFMNRGHNMLQLVEYLRAKAMVFRGQHDKRAETKCLNDLATMGFPIAEEAA